MVKPSVKTGFSREIDLGKFNRESRRLLACGFLFAVLFHIGLTILVTHRTPKVRVTLRKEPHRIIHTDIIELPPRLTTPFTVSKPRFTPRTIRPEGIPRSGPALPATPGNLFKSLPDPLMERLGTFSPEMPRVPDEKGVADSAFQYPGGIAPGNIVERWIPGESTLDEELLRPEDFEKTKEGRITSLLEYNPEEKLAIRGIVPICELWGEIGPVQLTKEANFL